MYGTYLGAVSNQERVMMARVRYTYVIYIIYIYCVYSHESGERKRTQRELSPFISWGAKV